MLFNLILLQFILFLLPCLTYKKRQIDNQMNLQWFNNQQLFILLLSQLTCYSKLINIYKKVTFSVIMIITIMMMMKETNK